MFRSRVIPTLLLKNKGLVKTVKFKETKYVGDPINAIKIFNEKEVDELIFLDIMASRENRKPCINTIKQIASECFMPLAYGGGIRHLEEISHILNAGAEKVVINSYAVQNPGFIYEASQVFGSQSIVISIDYKKSLFGKYGIYTFGGAKATRWNPVDFAVLMEQKGAGEIVLNSMDRDGTMTGYDLDILKKVTEAVTVPVIASGGAGRLQDFHDAINIGGASAVTAGSLFVFHGKHRAVLINFPFPNELKEIGI